MSCTWVWTDGVDCSTGELRLRGAATAIRLEVVPYHPGRWVAVAHWPYARPQPVAGPFPRRDEARRAGERYVAAAAQELAEGLREAA
jgi:hypothetical protein